MDVRSTGTTRRDLLRATGLGISLAAASPLLGACGGLGSDKSSSSTAKKTLKIGFVSPRTGPAAGFGEPDGYVLTLAKKALAGGLTVGGTQYEVQILDRDSQSNPQRSAQVANDLINGEAVDMMLKNRHTTARLAWEPRFHDPHLPKWLHRIDVPVKIVWGEQDRIIPVKFTEQYKKLLTKVGYYQATYGYRRNA